MYNVGDRIEYCNGERSINGEMATIIRIMHDELDYKGREGVEVVWDNPEKTTRVLSYTSSINNPRGNPFGTYLWPEVFKVVIKKEPDWRL